LLVEYWAGPRVVSRGRLQDATRLPGIIALYDGQPQGLLTYRFYGGECELVTLNSLKPGLGIGSTLVRELKKRAREAGCSRLWLITTNDNTAALRFYQQQGFVLAALHCCSIVEARRLKPQIPLMGLNNIPIRDELELEFTLVKEKKSGDALPDGNEEARDS